MDKAIKYCLLICALIFAQSINAQQSSVESFKEKFPPSNEVKLALEQIYSVIPAQESALKQFEKRYAKNLELRAFACSQFGSNEEGNPEKNNHLKDKFKTCLTEQDDKLLQIIGLSAVGFLIAQPPIKSLSKLGTDSLIPIPENKEVIGGAAASKSNVAVLRYNSGEFVSIEIPSGKIISNLPTMQTASDDGTTLSPNGRLTVIDGKFFDNQTGKALWQPKNISRFYAWLPEVQAALISSRTLNDAELLILDFKTGEIAPYNIPYKNQTWALNITESPSRILIGFGSDFTQIENIRTKTSIIGRVIKDYKLVKSGITFGAPILMQHGESIFFRSYLISNNNFFTLYNLKTGEEKLFDTSKSFSQNNNEYAKLSENEVLNITYDRISHIPKPWAFNVKTSTLSPIEIGEFWGRVIRLGERIGFIRSYVPKGVWIGDEWKTGKPVSLTSVISNDLESKNLSCGTLFGSRISPPTIFPTNTIELTENSVVKLEVKNNEDTITIEINGRSSNGNRTFQLKKGINKVDFIVTGEGEVHSWQSAIKVDDEIVFNHQQNKLPAKVCEGEIYRYSLYFNIK